ncbi:hypothetical protein ACVW0P_003631 [Mucilaginibacter sp. UYNi724]
MNNEKLPSEMNDDELNKFHTDAIAEKYNLNLLSEQNKVNEVVNNFPKNGTYQEKRAYLDDAVKKEIIISYLPVYTAGEANDNCGFSLSIYGTNERILL